MNKEEIKRISQSIEVTLRIGKNGLSENLFKEVEKQIKKRGLIKVKCLNNFLRENEIKASDVAGEIARILSLESIVKGNTILFYKENQRVMPKFKE